MNNPSNRPAFRPSPFHVGPVYSAVAGPGAAVPGETTIQRLAQLFAQEPELILAYLESASCEGSPDATAILIAARAAVSQRPEYADLHYFAAQAAVRADDPAGARDLLLRALQLNPRYNDALILAARVCMTQGQHGEALAYLRRALINGADYADVHLMLGDLWRQRDDALQARRAYQRALDLNANLAPARSGLAALNGSGAGGGGA